MRTPAQAIVIGGGISGLACAFRLRQLGIPFLLLEQDPRPGGVIESVEQDGFLFELGPQSFQANDNVLELTNRLGLSSELRQADPRAPRYILTAGRLRRVPMSPPALLSTSLLSPSTKLRLLAEPLRKSRPPADDESVAAFVRRKFGQQLLDILVGPFVSGVYAGDPEKLSLRSAFPTVYQWEKEHGSAIRGALKSRRPKHKPRPALCSFQAGVATLIRALAEKLTDSARCGARVTAVHRSKTDGKPSFALQVSTGVRAGPLTVPSVIVATDARSAGQLLAGVSPQFAEYFAKIEYAPVAVIGVGYRREQIGHSTNGFGFLVPRKEKLRMLGTVWNSSLFPDRAPQGMVSLSIFAGGATDRGLFDWSDAQIAETVTRELAEVLRISGPPVTRIIKRWPRALPQYNLGHANMISALSKLCAGIPGLLMTGNYLEGPAIGACVDHAFRTADSVRQYLASIGQTARATELDPHTLADHR